MNEADGNAIIYLAETDALENKMQVWPDDWSYMESEE